MSSKYLFLLFIIYLFASEMINAQDAQTFLHTRHGDHISLITMGSERAPHCTVAEYPDFLVLHEIPSIPIPEHVQDSTLSEVEKAEPLFAILDSLFPGKAIKYILNSHHHNHSLSTITPFLQKGAKLVTTKENLESFNKRDLFGDEGSEAYAKSIVEVSSDTIILAESSNPITVLYLEKSIYTSIPSRTYLFFYFSEQKLLATSCMAYMKDIDEKYGFKGMIYSNRMVDVQEVIKDKEVDVANTLQLYKFRSENGIRKPPIFSLAYFQNVLEHSWHRRALSEHLQGMSIEKLTNKRDSILNYFIESDIYHIVLNHAVYELIEKKEYQKAVALAQILVNYEPNRLNEIDTLGEAYFNNGQLEIAKHYDGILKSSDKNIDGLGIGEWEANQKKRLANGT